MEKPKRHRWQTKTDTSPIHRFRFSEHEWKMILEAVGCYADHLAQVEYPKVKQLYDLLIRENMSYHEGLHETWLGVKPGDPQFEAYQKVNPEYEGIRHKVGVLNAIERQLLLTFRLIDPKTPHWAYTKDRIMR